jgi:hypothetical protein
MAIFMLSALLTPPGWLRVGDVQPIAMAGVFDGRRGVQLSVRRNQYPNQNVMLVQRVPLRGLYFSVSIYPTADCDDSADANVLLGVQIVDAQWKRVTFCISSIDRELRVIGQRNGNVLILVPGRLHAWNTLDSRIGGILELIPLQPDPNGMVGIGPVATLHVGSDGDRRPPSISADFADFRWHASQ